MKERHEIVSIEQVGSKIYEFRGQKVMLDKDLADFYGVTVKRLNEQVKRNGYRFPEGFYFQLNNHEVFNLKSQNATSSWGGKRKLPYVYSRDGAVMASYVLKSEYAVAKSIYVVRAFNAISDIIPAVKEILKRVESLEDTVQKDKSINENFRFSVNRMLAKTARQGDFAVLLEDMDRFKKEIGDIKKLVRNIVERDK
jgi:hypothetical protein